MNDLMKNFVVWALIAVAVLVIASRADETIERADRRRIDTQ